MDKLKRAMDIGLVLASIPLTVPLAVGVGLLVRAKLGRPILFRQRRPGLHGRPFQMFKFRTMTDARDEAGHLLPDELRLTTFGKLLRSTSLDELPELLNVLKGDMSLVGPRPLLMQYLGRYTPEQARRHEVHPGLTGLAQIRGRNSISWEKKFALDVWYVDHRTAWLDIQLMVQTLAVVLRRSSINPAGRESTPEFVGSPPSSRMNDIL